MKEKIKLKKCIAFLLTAVMVLSLLPTTVFAAEEGSRETGSEPVAAVSQNSDTQSDPDTAAIEENVAQIGEQKYTTFAEAYSKVGTGETITVLKDTSWTTSGKSLTVSKTFTIDLNGCTLNLERSGSTTSFYLDLTSTGKTLTIKDSKGDGKLTSANSTYLIRLYKGNLTLESGTLEVTKATRTIYLNNSNSVFTMKGGTLINANTYKGENSNVLEVSSGTAKLLGGSIKATNETAPVCGVKVGNSSATVTVEGTTISTGTAYGIWTADAGTLNLKRASFEGSSGANVYLKDGDAKAYIGEEGQADFAINKLLVGNLAGNIKVADNVTVECLEAAPSSDGDTDYTFKRSNTFGGKYGNDFTANIIGIAFICQKIEGSEHYKVVPLDENDERIVATVTHGDGTKDNFAKADAAFAALQNGDTLTLKQDLVNDSEDSLNTTASNITIDLNGHNISAENASSGIWIRPSGSKVLKGDQVKIVGSGSITAKDNAINAEALSSKDTKPMYDIVLDKNVKLNISSDGSGAPVYLSSIQSRLLVEDTSVDYTKLTNGRFQTEVDGKKYIYAHFNRAINDSTNHNVIMLGDYSVKSTSFNTVTNADMVELDLNGHTLSFTTQNGIVSNGKGLTIKNGTIEHDYEKSSANSYGYAVATTAKGQSGSSMILEGVTINEKSEYATALTPNGTLKNVNITLKDSIVNCSGTGATVGIYFPVENGTLNIENTEVTAMNAVQIKGGTATVKGDKTKITSTGEKAEPGVASSSCTNTGDAIYVEDTYGFNPVVKIENGTIVSENNGALNYYDNNDQEGSTGKIEVSGGEFSNDVTQYCAQNEKTVQTTNSNGKYVIVPANVFVEMKVESGDMVSYSDQAAFMAALTKATGDIQIRLLGDVEIAGYVPVKEGQNVTFDLNGKRLSTSVQQNDTSRHYYAIHNEGTLCIKDSSSDGSGTIRARGVENINNGKLTVESGTIVAVDDNGGSCIWNEAELIVNGGVFKTEHVGSASDSIGISNLYNEGSAIITGGTFENVNKRNYAVISSGKIEVTPAKDSVVTIHGAHGGLGVDAGTAVINGGDFSSDEYYGLYVSNDGTGTDPEIAAVTVNGGTFSGKTYSVWVGSDINDPVNSTLAITGGTFEKPLNAQENTVKGAIVVSGGNFSEIVPEEYCAEGFVPVTEPDANGKFTVEEKAADYSKVDAAIAKANALNKTNYKDFSAVEKAIKAVVRDKNITEQTEVDAMAKAIEDAMSSLEYKAADYSKVDAAIAKANALNKTNYKDFSAVEKAIKAVVRDKNITEQAEVDAMAKAIEDAVTGLQKKPVETVTKAQITAGTNNLNKKIKATWSKNNLIISWGKVSKADGYEIYAAKCTVKYKKIKTIKGNKTFKYTIKSISGKKLNTKLTYKVTVKAYRIINKKKVYVGTSYSMHTVGKSNKIYTNPKSARATVKRVVLKKGKSKKISVKITKQNSRKNLLKTIHTARLRYFSTNTKVATITKGGTISAKGKGGCIIYAVTANGVKTTVKVTVR